ncbi:sensor histidine kinase [Muricoccus aerilatus]|uniref:sensor histidine kinase n=1 Tax=Muricoccus aerilatus TaxID=452982 RepID=UPI000694EB49|nr:MEDS domain-containing protein [Roseomonas aerilata]
MSQHVSSGIDAIGGMPWGTHFCQFYETAGDLAETLVPYFKAGLDAGERCMWVTAEPLRAGDATDALRAAVPDLDRRIARGDIEIIDYDRWYGMLSGKAGADAVLEGWLRREAEALERGYPGLRVTGNTHFVEAQDWESFAEYEGKVNACFCDHRIVTICSYCTRRCDAGQVLDVIQNHEFALARRRGTWAMVESSSVKQAKAALARANAELEGRVEKRTADLRKALAEKDVLLKEVHHRVKNNLQVVAALVQMRARQSSDASWREALAETLRRLKAMSLVHDQLYNGVDTGGINFASYLRSLAEATLSSYGLTEGVEIEVAPSDDLVDINTAVPLGLAAAEALTNALKHGFPNGRRGQVWMAFRAPRDGADGELVIRDDGVGPPDPMPARPRGAGLFLASALAGQIRGRVSLTRERDTVWRLTFPQAARREEGEDGVADGAPAHGVH